jgi:hypothetical protein
MRALTPPEEDRHLFTHERWSTGFRWFRAPNVVCLEHYRSNTSLCPTPHTGRQVEFCNGCNAFSGLWAATP